MWAGAARREAGEGGQVPLLGRMEPLREALEREVVDSQHARHGRGEGPDIERTVQYVEPVTPG